MNSKIVFILAIAFCLQGTQAETIDEVISDLTPKIALVKTEIEGVIRDGGVRIGDTHKIVANLVTEAETSLQTQVEQLEALVQQAEAEAAQKQVDISKCVNGVHAALSNLNIHQLDACNHQEVLNTLRVKLGELRHLKSVLSKSVDTCLAQNPVNPVGLRSCVEGDIESAAHQMNQIHEELNVGTEEATRNAESCVQVHSQGILATIDSAAHEFKNCVSNIL